jgi:hypothetical protein
MGVSAAWWLAAARLFGLLRAQAAPRAAMGPTWALVSAVLALVLAPVLVPPRAALTGLGGTELVLAAGFEFLLGTVLGAFVALAGHALVGGAQVSGAALLPADRRGGLVLLTVCLGLGVGLGLGLHRPLLAALADLGQRFPLGEPARWLASDAGVPGVAHIVAAARSATVLALALAAPVLLVHLVLDALTGLAAGSSGATDSPGNEAIEMVGGWARLALCLLALSAAWLTFPEAWGRGWGTL